jgi:uncharacterized membrane protein required for colicin V production
MPLLETLVLLLVALVALIEGKRGFGRGLFDLAGAILTVKLSRTLAFALAPNVHLFASGTGNEAALLVAFAAVLGTAFVFAARFLYDITLISLDAFDSVFGLFLGLASGVAVAHILLLAMLMGSVPAKRPQIKQTRVFRECVNFESYHSFINFLETAGR